MRTIAILSQKGGAGKTTLALNLAVAAERAGRRVLVLDMDPQASASAWKDLRAGVAPEVMSVAPGRFSRAMDAARGSRLVDTVIVDTAPHALDVAFQAAKASDLILIPCRHGYLDVAAIGATADIAERAARPAWVVWNAMPIRAPRILADVTAAAAKIGLRAAPVALHQRAAFSAAITCGQVAQEYEPDGKAAAEVADLAGWLERQP